jgi:DNA invertase Pin-like site-specific DNA recombinase
MCYIKPFVLSKSQSVNTSPKAYSYIRFSTPEQQNGNSFERQYKMTLEYAHTHGLIIDERLTYKDLGVSAFDRSNVKDGELGVFLKAVESGLVPVGSFLLVESLDRLSRAKISEALPIFLSIVNKGITIVTLLDQMEYSKTKIDKQFTDLIISISIMSRAHEESLAKSKRLLAAWESKRKNIGVKKLTSTAPGWLKLNQEKTEFLEIPERVKLVQDIFEWTKNGIGTGTITTRLNRENIPSFGVRGREMWYDSYIQKILHNRAVIGEFQPHKVIEGKRVPVGDPIKDYFPRIISDELHVLALSARKSRLTHGAGRKGKGISNLFSGLLKCGYCHGSMVYMNKGSAGPRGKLLVCGNAKAGKECLYIPWEYSFFEQSILTYCQGLDLDTFLQPDQKATSEMVKLSDRIQLMKAEIEAIEKKEFNILSAIEAGAKFQQFEARARTLSEEREQTEIALKTAQKKYEIFSTSKVDIESVRSSLTEFINLMNQKNGDELHDLRAALSQQVKRIVARIAMYPGGYIEKHEYITALREHLLKKGYSLEEIEEHIANSYITTPNQSRRFFTMVSRTGTVRMIRPSEANPEILHLETQTDDLALNLETHADAIGVMTEVLGNKKTKKLTKPSQNKN